MSTTWILLLLLATAVAGSGGARASDTPTLILVRGAGGEEQYTTNFLHQVDRWQATARAAGAETITIGIDEPGEEPDRDRLQHALNHQPVDAGGPLWLVLIGHGTFDGKSARFNLRGPDMDAEELRSWLAPIRRPLVVINTASASAPFLPALAATNRVVITATRSGSELNFTRFGQHLADALADPDSDLDRDEQTSLLEAFLTASARVRDVYQAEGRLATEHALIDDTGDGKGTPAEWFRGVRARKQPNEDAPVDGAVAHQIHFVASPAERLLPPAVREERDALERQVFRLRGQKDEWDEEAEYLEQLEAILVELARLYDAAAPREQEE